MIGYVTLGTADIARGAAFYDAIAKVIGSEILSELLETFHDVYEGVKDNPSALDQEMRSKIFG
ncbi:MAG: hypothetical protein AAFQ15_12130, partial [Pseudomonadota bacterium]